MSETMNERMIERKGLIQTVISAVISGAVAGAIVGAFLKWHFDKSFEEFRSARSRNEAVLTEVVGPATMHFARTEAIAARYGSKSSKQLFGDADLLKASNKTMRDLLISKGYLIPTELMKASQCLVVHYDIWLKRFEATIQEFKTEHNREPFINDHFDIGFSEFDDGECGGFNKQLPKLLQRQRLRL